MTTPLAYGSPASPRRMLGISRQNSRTLWIGDSVSFGSYEPLLFRCWSVPLRGKFFRTNLNNGGAGNDAYHTSGQGGMDLAPGILNLGGYTPFSGAYENKFTGTQYPAYTSFVGQPLQWLNNRICEVQGDLGETTRTSNSFTGGDWLNTAGSDLHAQAMIYRTTGGVTSAHVGWAIGSDNGLAGDHGNVNFNAASNGHALLPAVSLPAMANYCRIEAQMGDSQTPVANSNAIIVGGLVEDRNVTGMTLIPCSITGMSVSKWLSMVTQAAMNDAFGLLGITDVVISLSYNGSKYNNDTGSFIYIQNDFRDVMIQLVAALKTACPNATITLLSNYPSFGSTNTDSGGGVIVDLGRIYTDGTFAAAVAAGENFINVHDAVPSYSFLEAANIISGDRTHLTATGGPYMLGVMQGLFGQLAIGTGTISDSTGRVSLASRSSVASGNRVSLA